MGLNAVDGTPGLWVGEEWKTGTPGLFAVVIGVSAYDHLNGSPETYNLGQLSVSALTAYRIFEWLRDDFKLDGCPIANVWLLLAPTDQEKLFEPALVKHSLAPTIHSDRTTPDSRLSGSWSSRVFPGNRRLRPRIA